MPLSVKCGLAIKKNPKQSTRLGLLRFASTQASEPSGRGVGGWGAARFGVLLQIRTGLYCRNTHHALVCAARSVGAARSKWRD
jgi:hypothetical protein